MGEGNQYTHYSIGIRSEFAANQSSNVCNDGLILRENSTLRALQEVFLEVPLELEHVPKVFCSGKSKTAVHLRRYAVYIVPPGQEQVTVIAPSAHRFRCSPAMPIVLPMNSFSRLKIPYAHLPMSSAAIPGNFLSPIGMVRPSTPVRSLFSGPYRNISGCPSKMMCAEESQEVRYL